MEEKEKVVGGFYFAEEKMAELARHEAEGVAYIRSRTDLQNPEMVQKLYHRVLEENVFETPIGMTFLKEIRDYLSMIPGIDQRELAAIDTAKFEHAAKPEPVKKEKKEEFRKEKNGEQERRLKRMRKGIRFSVLCNLFLFIVALGMIFLNLSSSRPNILDYENKLLNQYAGWEQELSDREELLRQKEQELGITP